MDGKNVNTPIDRDVYDLKEKLPRSITWEHVITAGLQILTTVGVNNLDKLLLSLKEKMGKNDFGGGQG